MRSAEAGLLKVHPAGSRLGACDALVAIAPPNRRWLRLVLVGHDTNTSHVGGAVGVAWQLPAAPPNSTPPGGALVWELWRAGLPRGGWAKSASVVRIIYIAQSLGQMRRAIPPTLASPPLQAPANIGACGGNTCSLRQFLRILRTGVRQP